MTLEQDTLARTIWGEARGEGVPGMAAVAYVILNRAANPRWWGHDIVSVCRAPMQFSCWLPAPQGELETLLHIAPGAAAWADAQRIAAQAIAGALDDTTAGADSYVNLHVASPAWARGRTPCAVIGRQAFFRLELPPPA
jgi:spore germination cell wall hydrolase CwlJ-like protein